FPAMSHDAAFAAVDGCDHSRGADRVGELARELKMRAPILEEGRARNNLFRAGGKYVLRARDGANAAADATRERPRDLPDEREIVAGVFCGVEVDHLHLREAGEPSHPAKHIVVFDREALALNELDDGAGLQID